jgi:hypothetical protein
LRKSTSSIGVREIAITKSLRLSFSSQELPIFSTIIINFLPAPVLHLQDTISWLVNNPDKYLIDPSKIILSGYSCGGKMIIPLGIYFASKSYFFKKFALHFPYL